MAEGKKNYIPLEKLEVYQLARKLSKIAWTIHENLEWQDKKTMGDQFLSATDSVGANIVEGYRRYHHLERIKFFYTSRASLAEANDHWLALLYERKRIHEDVFRKFQKISEKLLFKLNNFIASVYRSKEKQ